LCDERRGEHRTLNEEEMSRPIPLTLILSPKGRGKTRIFSLSL
jgi:hypothetical protein